MPRRSRAYRGYQLQLRQLVPERCAPISFDGMNIVASRGCLITADDEWREEARARSLDRPAAPMV
jgi:hypothetical protein